MIGNPVGLDHPILPLGRDAHLRGRQRRSYTRCGHDIPFVAWMSEDMPDENKTQATKTKPSIKMRGHMD